MGSEGLEGKPRLLSGIQSDPTPCNLASRSVQKLVAVQGEVLVLAQPPQP